MAKPIRNLHFKHVNWSKIANQMGEHQLKVTPEI